MGRWSRATQAALEGNARVFELLGEKVIATPAGSILSVLCVVSILAALIAGIYRVLLFRFE